MNVRMRSRYVDVRYFLAVLGLSWALNQFLLQPQFARTATFRQVTALAAADFDEDGTPDLAETGMVDAGGGVRLRRGHQAAVYPNSPAAQSLRAQDAAAAAPFLPAAVSFPLPVAPDWLAAGDFDADGHLDLAAAARED